jgi:hypothetical protein
MNLFYFAISEPENINLARSLLSIFKFIVDSICFCVINMFRIL